MNQPIEKTLRGDFWLRLWYKLLGKPLFTDRMAYLGAISVVCGILLAIFQVPYDNYAYIPFCIIPCYLIVVAFALAPISAMKEYRIYKIAKQYNFPVEYVRGLAAYLF